MMTAAAKAVFHVRRRSSLSSSASQSTKRMKCLAMRRASSAVHMCVRLASVNVFTSTQQRIMVIFCGGSQPPSASDPFSIQYCCIDWDFSSSSFELFSFLLYTILPWLLALWDFFVLSLFFLSFSRWLAFLSISGSHSIRHRCPFHSLGLEDLHAQRTADIRSQQPSQSSNTKEASHIRAKDKEENQEKTKSNKNQRTNKQTKKKRWWLFCSIFRQGLAFSSSSSPSFYWALVTGIFFFLFWWWRWSCSLAIFLCLKTSRLLPSRCGCKASSMVLIGHRLLLKKRWREPRGREREKKKNKRKSHCFLLQRDAIVTEAESRLFSRKGANSDDLWTDGRCCSKELVATWAEIKDWRE